MKSTKFNVLVLVFVAMIVVTGCNSSSQATTTTKASSPKERGDCEKKASTLSGVSVGFRNALPPDDPDRLYDEADLVITGRVCEITHTSTDGDQAQKEREERCGGPCPGPGTANSQEVRIEVHDVQKGSEDQSIISVKKPISAYTLEVGDEGTFYLNDGELLGEYGPKVN